MGLEDFKIKIESGGNKSGELLRSNLPPFSFSGVSIEIVSSSIDTFTPNCSMMSIKTSSPWGRFPIFPLIENFSPHKTEADNNKARLEKSIGTVNVVSL